MTVQALIADPEAPPRPPAPVLDTRPCETCGAPLARGQGWCLECGSAAAGALGRGPNWRQALSVIALTLLIVGGAVAASYAALTHQSKRATTAPKVVAATPPPATTPPVTTTPVAPKAPTTAVKPVAPKVTPTATPAPAPAATPAKPVAAPAVPTPSAAKPSAPKSSTGTGGGQSNKTGQAGRTILLDPNAASTYNPYSLPDASFGDPSLAIDGDPSTAWTYTLDPATAGKTTVGLVIDLKSPQRLGLLKLHVTSPGITTEIYGANGQLPVSLADPAWIHLATRAHVKSEAKMTLKTAGKSYRRVLIWITHAPPGKTAGNIGIAELSLVR